MCSPGWGRPWRRPWSVFRLWSGRSAWRFKGWIRGSRWPLGAWGPAAWALFSPIALPLARQGLVAGFLLAFARSLGEFGATIMVAGNIEGRTQTIPLAIYAMANTPGGMEATWRLVGLSILLACTTLAASEWLERRRPLDVRA